MQVPHTAGKHAAGQHSTTAAGREGNNASKDGLSANPDTPPRTSKEHSRAQQQQAQHKQGNAQQQEARP